MDQIPALYAGPGSTSSEDWRALARIDTAFQNWPQVNGFYLLDRHLTKAAGLGPLTPIEVTTTDTRPLHNLQLTMRRVLKGYALELSSSGSTGTSHVDPTPPGTRNGPYPRSEASTGLSSVNAAEYSDVSNRRNTLAATVVHNAAFVGTLHSLEAGFEHDRVDVLSRWGIPGGRFYDDLDGMPFMVYLLEPDSYWARTTRTTLYAQEKWMLRRGVTVEPGVRLSMNRGHLSQGVVVSTNPVAPRLGVAWDVAERHSTVVRAHVGRYHDALLTANFQPMDTDNHPPFITATVAGPDEFVEISRSTSSRYAADPRLAQPYFDQWLVAVERAITPGLQANAQLVERRYGGLMGYVDNGSIYQPLRLPDPGPDGRAGTVDDGELVTVFKKMNPGNEIFYLTNPAGAYRRYTALQFAARFRRGSDWHATASYSRSKTRGNVENALRSNSGGPELGTNGVFSDPNRAINGDGLSSFDYTHEIKVLAAAQPRWLGGVQISGVYQYRTGLALGRTAQFPAIGQVIFGVRMEPRGTLRTEALNTADLRLQRAVPLSSGRTLAAYADIFNVNNQGAPDSARRRAVSELSGPLFRQPLFWMSPRTLRVGVRVAF